VIPAYNEETTVVGCSHAHLGAHGAAQRDQSRYRDDEEAALHSARGQWIYFRLPDGQVPPRLSSRRSGVARTGAALVVGRRIPRRDPAARVLIEHRPRIAGRAKGVTPRHRTAISVSSRCGSPSRPPSSTAKRRL